MIRLLAAGLSLTTLSLLLTIAAFTPDRGPSTTSLTHSNSVLPPP